MTFTTEQILEHYRKEAERHGDGGTSTIQDIRTRFLELQALLSYLKPGMKVLEVGCGNGYTAQHIVENIDIDLDATDFSADMVEIAKRRQSEPAIGRVTFACQDIIALDRPAAYDLIFSERCLQNLTSWEDQQKALTNIAAAMKSEGQFIMLESFQTGHNLLNAARQELDLPEISPPWHNLFFDEEMTKQFMVRQGCSYVDQNTFLSGYYFGSRVIMPALMPKGKEVTSKSVLNDYFCHLPPYGDFCPMKILRFRKG